MDTSILSIKSLLTDDHVLSRDHVEEIFSPDISVAYLEDYSNINRDASLNKLANVPKV